MEKLLLLFSVFKSGNEIYQRQRVNGTGITINYIVAFLGAVLALLNSFGYNIEISTDQLLSISGGLISVYAILQNLWTSATNKDVSLSPIDNAKLIVAKQTLPEADQELSNLIKDNQSE